MPLYSPNPDAVIPDESIFDYVFGDIAPEHADKVAFVDSGATTTYSELKSMVEAFAGALAARGIGKGDVVALHCPNSTTFAVAYHGILRANAAVTTVATLATAEDVAKQLTASGAKMILTTSAIGWAGTNGAENAGFTGDQIIGLTGVHGISEMIAEGHPAPEQDIDPSTDVAVIPFSSGTTGVPKGVMLSHTNLIANLVQVTDGTTTILGEDTVAVTPLPFFHIYGMNALLNLLLRMRATQYTMSKFDLGDFLEIIQDHKANFAFIAPPIAVALAKHPAVDQYDTSSMKTMLSGAASLKEELAKQVEDRLDCEMVQGYGMTEMSPVSHLRVGDAAPLNSIGTAVCNTEFKIVDVASDDLPEIPKPDSGHSAPGELWVRGPQVMLGYLNNEEATKSTLLEGGWLRTGDMAELDADGNTYIVDRLKELIKYKGYQVAPAELEAVLLEHPKIADAACSGIIGRDGEEIPKAYVVAQPDSGLTESDVMEFVEQRVAPYKKVRAVEFLEAIPKSATGKILRKDLKAMEAARG
ncbi:AMP-binding protein [uncultured Corynebacterium sp.]|uniref:AMP-binding protein n=1 Tax=uncultured Corynebacterium sp. TaxID=159447 RepID=UPI0025D19EEA|nr:AMP-binding protein [uncultured Corynebacterium sp.]